MTNQQSRERSVVVHTAGTATEALVIRGLLESVGIVSPGSASTDPFPLREAPEGFRDTEIIVMESQADAARHIIADYLNSNEGIELEDSEDSKEGTES
jgi:hypothetical protein